MVRQPDATSWIEISNSKRCRDHRDNYNPDIQRKNQPSCTALCSFHPNNITASFGQHGVAPNAMQLGNLLAYSYSAKANGLLHPEAPLVLGERDRVQCPNTVLLG